MLKFHDRFINLEYREYPLNERFPIYALLNGEFAFQSELPADLTFLHFHNCVEIGIIHEGACQLYVENQSISLKQGDIFLLPPYTMHISIPTESHTSCSCEYLYLLPDVLLGDLLPDHLPDTLLPYQFQNFPLTFSSSQYPEIFSLVLLLLDALREKKSNYKIGIRGLVLTLMTEFSRALPKHAPHTAGNEILPILLPALSHIEQHYAAPLSVDFLAEICHVSTSHFHKLFKRSLNQSPIHYIQHVRLSHACTLLQSTEYSILEIALSVGFSSIANFNRIFQKLYQQTPRQWRNEKRSIQKKNLLHSVFPIAP